MDARIQAHCDSCKKWSPIEVKSIVALKRKGHSPRTFHTCPRCETMNSQLLTPQVLLMLTSHGIRVLDLEEGTGEPLTPDDLIDFALNVDTELDALLSQN